MKVNTSVKLLIRILIIIVLIILSIITVFNAGRKSNIEEINTKYKEYNYKYIIHAYKLKLVQEKTKQDNPPNLIESENKNINEYNIPKEMIYSQELKGLVNDGFIKLQLQNDGLYHVVRRSELPHTHGN